MHIRRLRSTRAAIAAALFAGALALSSCASSTPESPAEGSSGTEATDAETAFSGIDLVSPVNIYPPYGMIVDGEYTGMTVDLANAVADDLGLKISHQDDAWENILTGVQSGSYMWVYGAEITQERLESFDFVYFMDTFARFIATEESGEIGDDWQDLCGLTISAVSGATLAESLPQTSEQCVEAGEEAIKTDSYKDLAAALLAVESGQADAAAVDYLSAVDVVDENDGLILTGPEYHRSKSGIALQKGSPAVEVVADSVTRLIDSGEYQKVLDDYGMGEFAIDAVEINPEPAEE